MAASDRWKYLVTHLKASGAHGFLTGQVSDQQLQHELDQRGQLGWELVQMIVTHGHCKLVFKKPS